MRIKLFHSASEAEKARKKCDNKQAKKEDKAAKKAVKKEEVLNLVGRLADQIQSILPILDGFRVRLEQLEDVKTRKNKIPVADPDHTTD
jgi:hypothetical protein